MSTQIHFYYWKICKGNLSGILCEKPPPEAATLIPRLCISSDQASLLAVKQNGFSFTVLEIRRLGVGQTTQCKIILNLRKLLQ